MHKGVFLPFLLNFCFRNILISGIIYAIVCTDSLMVSVPSYTAQLWPEFDSPLSTQCFPVISQQSYPNKGKKSP